MARRPEIQAVLTAQGWMVSIPPSLAANGNRERRFFGDGKTKAEKFAKELRNKYHLGERAATLKPLDAAMAAEAIRLLEPVGITLLEAARAAVARWEESQSSETFRERWLAYTSRMEDHWRQTYSDQMAKMPRWLPEWFMETRIHEITDATIHKALTHDRKLFDATIRMRATRVRAILAGRGGRRRSKSVALLSREQLAKLKWHARKDADLRRVVGVLLFAGIRPDAETGEISRLDWEMFGAREIYIDHDVSKTGSDRHIPIERRLRWWIRGHPKDGPVAPSGWRKKWRVLRKLAGIGRESDLTRHTFASHFLAVHGEQETKQAMGHTKDSDTLFRHYRKAITKRDGRRYFGLLVEGPGC